MYGVKMSDIAYSCCYPLLHPDVMMTADIRPKTLHPGCLVTASTQASRGHTIVLHRICDSKYVIASVEPTRLDYCTKALIWLTLLKVVSRLPNQTR